MLDGQDLNEAVRRETGLPDIGKLNGFNGWLTQDQLDRRAASTQAVLLALHGLGKNV
jgi:non-canonical (house-cleaning) NTP pyrophosphatase